LPLFTLHFTQPDGIRSCSFFLSSKAHVQHPRFTHIARAYGLTTPQETKTPRSFPFRSIQRVLSLILITDNRLKHNHILQTPPPTTSKRKYRAPSEATSPTDSTSAADLHPSTTKRTRFSLGEDIDSTSPRYDFRRRASLTQPESPVPRPTRNTGMPKSRYHSSCLC
jgi:hypothetical protein